MPCPDVEPGEVLTLDCRGWLPQGCDEQGSMVVQQAVHGSIQSICDPVVEARLARRSAALAIAKDHASQAERRFCKVSARLCNDVHTCQRTRLSAHVTSVVRKLLAMAGWGACTGGIIADCPTNYETDHSAIIHLSDRHALTKSKASRHLSETCNSVSS